MLLIFFLKIKLNIIKSKVISLLLLIMLTLTIAYSQPNIFIVVRNTRGEIVTYLVTLIVKGHSVKRLNVTHFVTYITNEVELTVLKDGVVVYRGNLTPSPRQITVDIVARLQHVTLHFPNLSSGLILVKYGSVVLTRYIKEGILELANIPYPTNITLEIPQEGYKTTIMYKGEETVEINFKEVNYNVYLRFYDVASKPLSVSLIKLIGVKAAKINETCIGLKILREAKLKVLYRGISVAEIKISPPSSKLDIKVINVKLPVGTLRVLAPTNSIVTITLPSGEKLTKRCDTGEVLFYNIPACKLLITLIKGNFKQERTITFPGSLTVSMVHEESILSAKGLLSAFPIIVALVISTMAMLRFRNKSKSKGDRKFPIELYTKISKPKNKRQYNKHKKSVLRSAKIPRTKYNLKLLERDQLEVKEPLSELAEFKAEDLAELINKLKRYRKELEKINQHSKR